MSLVNVAVVGIGGYGGQLVDLIRRHGEQLGCRLAAVADSRLAELSDRADELRHEGVEMYADALEMYRRCRRRCQAVYIATGIGSHSMLTIAAAVAGLHVHLEKPPAATIQETDQMLAALEANGRMCLAGFQGVHGPEMTFLQERIADGRLGAVRTLACSAGWPRDRAYYSRNDWAGRLRSGDNWVLDGPASNALSHQILHMLLLAGPEVGQYARPISVRGELYAAGPVASHDTGAIEIQTMEGPAIYWLGSHCSRERFGPVIEIRGEQATATLAPGRHATITYADGAQERRDAGDAGKEMIRNFVDAIRSGDGSSLRCTLADARGFVLALNGAHESSGRIHRIGEAMVRRENEGTPKARTIIDGLDDQLRAAADGSCLFSQLVPRPAWAVATGPYRLTNYTMFPRTFRDE